MKVKDLLVAGLTYLTSSNHAFAVPTISIGFYQELPPQHSSTTSSPTGQSPEGKSRNDKPLEEKIDLYIKGLRQDRYLAHSDRTSTIVYDLAEHKMIASINAEQTRMAASLIKPFVMVAVYDALEQGRVKETSALNRNLTSMITYDRGCSEANRATNRLLKVVGRNYANQVLQKYGFRETRIKELIPRDGRTYHNTTSARDLSALLRRIHQQQLVNPPADREMLQLLKRSYHTRLRAAGMEGIEIANKTGYVYGLNGDAGIVFMKDKEGKEHPYVVAVLIEDKSKPGARQRGSSWGKSRSKMIKEVSEIVYKEMRKRG